MTADQTANTLQPPHHKNAINTPTASLALLSIFLYFPLTSSKRLGPVTGVFAKANKRHARINL